MEEKKKMKQHEPQYLQHHPSRSFHRRLHNQQQYHRLHFSMHLLIATCISFLCSTQQTFSYQLPLLPLHLKYKLQQQHQQQQQRQKLRKNNNKFVSSPLFSSQSSSSAAQTTTTTSASASASASASSTSSNRVLGGEGMPSSPGWNMKRLERLTEWADSKAANRPIICEYEPSGRWLWTKWTGTVLRETWREVLGTMMITLLLHLVMAKKHSWPILTFAPPSVLAAVSSSSSSSPASASASVLSSLVGLKKLWEYQLTLATFILTFFTSQAFAYWQKVYNTTRIIQGRINDLCMLIAVGARRGRQQTGFTATINGENEKYNNDNDNNNNNNPEVNNIAAKDNDDDDNVYMPKPKGSAVSAIPDRRYLDKQAEDMVRTSTRLIRMSHIFFWAATPTASNGLNDCDQFIEDSENCPLPVDDLHIGPLLLSRYGLKALVRSGQLTDEESRDLMNTGLPPTQYAYVLLVWAGLRIIRGFEDGTMRGSPGLEENIFRLLTALRAAMFDIDDFRAGRMPLAYVQLVQVLVDSLVVVSPFALYPEVGSLSIILVGLLTLFFRGLLSLSKSFLDPFGVEGFEGQNIRVDVLVSEINFGAGQRWFKATSTLPPSVVSS